MTDAASYKAWKLSIPMLYDWFANHHLAWPSLCCRWGPKLSEATYKGFNNLYLSERTDDSEANKLIISQAEVIKPRVAAAEQIVNFKETERSHHIKIVKHILHPGEINKIKELGTPADSNIVVTHSDAKELFLWNVETQPDRVTQKGVKSAELSQPDLVLEGHTDNAQFALGCSVAEPLVASGGQDQNVLIWNVKDYDSGSLLKPKDKAAQPAQGPRLGARSVLRGHTATIEDVGYMPKSAHELVSVGDDNAMLLWDTRSGDAAASRVDGAHGNHDLHCVDWCGRDTHLIATGAADGSVKVWDRRKLSGSSGAAFTFTLHQQATMRIEWAPWQAGILASGGEDGRVCVWDLQRGTQPDAETLPAGSRIPPQLLFQHMGHRAQVVDFQWHPTDKFTMVSVSEHDAGGTLQLWRVSDLIHLPAEEAIAELEKHREFILDGKEPAPAQIPTKPGGKTGATALPVANGTHKPTTTSAPPPAQAAPVLAPTQANTSTPSAPTAVLAGAGGAEPMEVDVKQPSDTAAAVTGHESALPATQPIGAEGVLLPDTQPLGGM